MDLNGKVALVTGAARRVGQAIAFALAQRGATVAVHHRMSGNEANATVAQIRAAGGKAWPYMADLQHVVQIEAMIGHIEKDLGRLDILVNSASIFYRKAIAEVTEQDWDANLDINLKAPFFLAKSASAIMRRNGAGKIVNIGDWAGIRPYNNYLPYTVSKAGLIGLTKALAKALAPEVQVNCLALGPVLPPEGYDEAEVQRLARFTLTGRLGTPQDVVEGVLFFCEGSDFATGSTLVLDGGRLIK